MRANTHGGLDGVGKLLPSLLVLKNSFPLCWCRRTLSLSAGVEKSIPSLPRGRIRAGPGPDMPRRKPRDHRRLPLILEDLLLRPGGSPWQLLGETPPL